ncbi:hypothetical protein HanXRQr2_Chr15g0716591 [Helianthus annuus]|uniref:Uncharacterized protein n=1 Tax=Helianthus annuus TaxID=4232 RepID=A0A9K3E456_HELAN|nr:hypothetical protein HanXRQr2_Chr15g0716591 [Helianthus annuus]KAJ0452908.1 hypothetical protein HanHA300_Chr15g0584341 [Helianthus annuus]KAJ0474823.1 hypothetical protein HanHA89_Chr15g0634131 [Helianthus annuus]KAJ0650378.1 hypothetical protein HanLR1_Chr15g0595051 [Helianthus annuus]KAJ0654144.1 hypothetical protein HanOQP8_Chr15g0591601 [Helianthus annuus]
MGLPIKLLPELEKYMVATKHVKFSSNISKIFVNLPDSYCLNLKRLELEAKNHSK